jgi:hypothetical protein
LTSIVLKVQSTEQKSSWNLPTKHQSKFFIGSLGKPVLNDLLEQVVVSYLKKQLGQGMIQVVVVDSNLFMS